MLTTEEVRQNGTSAQKAIEDNRGVSNCAGVGGHWRQKGRIFSGAVLAGSELQLGVEMQAEQGWEQRRYNGEKIINPGAHPARTGYRGLRATCPRRLFFGGYTQGWVGAWEREPKGIGRRSQETALAESRLDQRLTRCGYVMRDACNWWSGN